MIIMKLSLRNFKGQTGDYDVPDQGLSFSGQNGAGKTTIIDAICWCLFGKFSDRTETSPKPRDENNKPITCDVEVEIQTTDTTYKRIYSEIWKTPRGKANKEFAGHETKYYLDDLPVQAREFNNKVNAIFSEEQFYMTAIPTFFFNTVTNWKDRRNVLFQLVKQPTEEELINHEPDLSEILIGSTPDEYEKKLLKAKNSLKKINTERPPLKDRIDELQRLIKEIEPLDELNAEIKAKKEEREQLKLAGKSGEIEKQVADLYTEISNLRQSKQDELHRLNTKADTEIDRQLKGLEHERADISKRQDETRKLLDDSQVKAEKYRSNIADIEREKPRIQGQITAARERIEDEQKSIESYENDIANLKPDTEICPACGQKLPKEQVEKQLTDMKSSYEKMIAESKETIERCEGILLRETNKITSKDKDLETLQGLLYQETAQIESINKEHVALTEKWRKLNSEYVEKAEELRTKYRDESNNVAKSYEEMIEAKQEKIAELKNQTITVDTNILDAEIQRLEERINQHKNNEGYRQRIKTLEDTKKELGRQAEEELKLIYLYELRIKTIAGLIEPQLINKFRIARFKLFHIQVNGEVQEVCEVLYNGKTTMSQGEAIYVGIDIADTLAKHWGIEPPLMIDGMQNITLPAETGRQKILTRTTTDKKLIVEEL